MLLPQYVKLVEVGPRDGLQNEKKIISTDIKIDFINRLSDTGLSVIETTSFVSAKWIPQLADHQEVFTRIRKKKSVCYPVLVPNLHGFKNALAAGAEDIAVFTTPSEEFCKKNINCSVTESIEKITEITQVARQHHIRVRGYLSCILGCPYQGEMDPDKVTDLADILIKLGCYEVSLGDTIGIGTPGKTKLLIEKIVKRIPLEKIAVHFHDTYGQALANIYVALEHGVQVVDSSVAGLGGCPYAKGATGNVATEDVLYMLNGLGIKTDVDIDKLIDIGRFITNHLEHPMYSKVNAAMRARC